MKRREIIKSTPESNIKSPHHIPVDVYIQEADELYQWAMSDKDALRTAGISTELIEDLPPRCSMLSETEAAWQTQRNTGRNMSPRSDGTARIAYDLRNRLLADFRYAFRRDPGLMNVLKNISQGENHANLVQDLNDLTVLGKANPLLLAVIGFDMTLLDNAAQTAAEMTALPSEISDCEQARRNAKKLRDRAYTHLKEAVDEIRRCGQYVFRRDKERLAGYRSHYLRRKKKAVRKKGRNSKSRIF